MKIDGVDIHVLGSIEIPEEEKIAYVERGKERYGDRLKEIFLKVCDDDPDEIEIEYTYRDKKFHRIRRITGYLVGSIDRWNNGKRAEEADRVKHTT